MEWISGVDEALMAEAVGLKVGVPALDVSMSDKGGASLGDSNFWFLAILNDVPKWKDIRSYVE